MTSKAGGGALAGLAGHYGSDSEDDIDQVGKSALHRNAQRSMWSMCVDPTTGCPYYWDQITNQVSWELPPGVVVTNTSTAPGGDEIIIDKPVSKSVHIQPKKQIPQVERKPVGKNSQRSDLPSSDEEEKIELITSYYNSDSGSGDENNDRSSNQKSTRNKINHKIVKSTVKNDVPALPYGPELPENIKLSSQKSSIDLFKDKKGQMPPGEHDKQKCISLNDKMRKEEHLTNAEGSNSTNGNIITVNEVIDRDPKKNTPIEAGNLDDLMVVQANLLKKLGELGPNEIKYLNGSKENSPLSNSRTQSPLQSPAIANSPGILKKATALDMDVDDLIAQIEMEQPIDQPGASDISSVGNIPSQDGSTSNKSISLNDDVLQLDPKSSNSFKPLFPCASFSSVLDANVNQKMDTDSLEKYEKDSITDMSMTTNKYESSLNESDGVENSAFKRKRRIAIDVLPAKKPLKCDENMFKRDLPYTMKYAQNNEISGERVGLGFSSDVDDDSKKDEKHSYPNFKKGDSLVFQKANDSETSINTDKEHFSSSSKAYETDKDLESMKNLLESKLKFLVQNLTPVPPVQQLFIELYTLWGALTSGALQKDFILEWLQTADTTLARLEASAAPHPWICRFHSGAGCYVYEHAETGKIQWEHPENEAPPPPPPTPPPAKPPAPPSPLPNEPTDMDISTTPPPQSHHDIRTHLNNDHTEPLPPGVETPMGIISPHLNADNSKLSLSGNEFDYKHCEPVNHPAHSDKLVAEIDSFYSVIAALEEPKTTTEKKPDKDILITSSMKKEVVVKSNTVDSPILKEKKKKSKVKTPSSMKDKTVSKLVEKWKKVQETIHE